MTPLITDFATIVAAEWDHLASAGTWFTGDERVAIAAAGRRSGDGLPATGNLGAAVAEAARRVAGAAGPIRAVDIEGWAEGGLDVHAYVEIVGLVSRVAGLDVAAFGLGLDREPLPVSRAGEPSREIPQNVELVDGWVPTHGVCSPSTALSAVPDANDALRAIQAALYLPAEQIDDLGTERDGLSRAQIELVAARTSALNNCGSVLDIHTAKLQASGQHHGAVVDCTPIGRGYSADDCGVASANEIFALVDSAVLGDLDEYPYARIRAELALGRDAADRVALATGNFTMMSQLMNAVIASPPP